MHYSDCYKHINHIQNKQLAAQIKKSLKKLELEIQSLNYIDYLKKNSGSEKSIVELRREFEKKRRQETIEGINKIINPLENEKDNAIVEIKKILDNIKLSASHYIHDSGSESHFYDLAKQYATHYIPFNQAFDPFHGTDWNGYCWGHSHRYAELASQRMLDTLSVASDKKLFDTFSRNWTFADILLRRVGWYFKVSQETKIRQAIWDAFSQLDDKTIFNFNYLINTAGFHSTGLRMVGKGIEYYDNNHGLVRFKSRQDAVDFLCKHLIREADNAQGSVTFITVYKLPYSNKVKHDVLKELPQAKINPHSLTRTPHGKSLQESIDKLKDYRMQLKTQSGIKAKVKANEIKYLTTELSSMGAEEIKLRIDSILQQKQHSLLLNRGSGLYFFKSGFKSHSTTEDLLKDIHSKASNTCN
jgi:hypothetical protein